MLTIEAIRGVWKSELDGRAEFADTLEELLQKLAPDAPPEYVWNAAEVLGGILGATVVEVEQDYSNPMKWQWLESAEWLEPEGKHFEQTPHGLVDELLEERKEEAARENEGT